MRKRIIAVSIAMLIILGAGTANAGATLYTPMLSAPIGGTLVCHVTNIGKKDLREVRVILRGPSGGSGNISCPDLRSVSVSGFDHTCSIAAEIEGSCQVEITGGNHRSVHAVLNVVDSSGATILSVPATK